MSFYVRVGVEIEDGNEGEEDGVDGENVSLARGYNSARGPETSGRRVLINQTGVRCKHPCRCVLFRRRRGRPFRLQELGSDNGTVRRGESVLCVEGPDGEQDQEERHDGDGSPEERRPRFLVPGDEVFAPRLDGREGG